MAASSEETVVTNVSWTRDDGSSSDIRIARYTGGDQLRQIMVLMSAELSEPYSIFTFRHFLEGWPQLCFVAHDGDRLVGAIVNKAELRAKTQRMRGYVAMLAVEKAYRRSGLGRRLAATGLQAMCEVCDEVSVFQASIYPDSTGRGFSLRTTFDACYLHDPTSIPFMQIVLETEECNTAALRLYERLGFVRDKRLPKYYLNNNDAFRLKAILR